MRAIIHSVHSQVPATVAKLTTRPRLIISMDSHLDVSRGGDDRLYPRDLRVFARRTGAHSLLARECGANPGSDGEGALVVAMPESMLAAHATYVESRLPPTLRISDIWESISSCVRFLRSSMGIEIYRSPPRSLLGLVPRTAGSEWMLDIDVDYIYEMQDECYTRIIGAGPRTLQRLAGVLGFVRKARPETIALSEAKVSAIRDPGSALSRLVGQLKVMGYRIEETGVFDDDEEVLAGISLCNEFYQKVSSVLVATHMQEMLEGRFNRFEEEESVAADKFFGGRRNRR